MNNVIKNITAILFGLLSFLVVILISLGINFDFAVIKTIAFWIEVFIKWVITMVIFNLVVHYDSFSRTHDQASRFFAAFATFRIRVKQIHKDKLYDKLSAAVKTKNEQIEKDLWTARLHRVCCRITFDEILNSTESSDELAKRLNIVKRRKKRKFKIIYEQIRSGERFKRFGLFPVKPIKDEFFLKDNELSKISIDKFSYSNIGEEGKRNFHKSILFILTSVITAVISYSFIAPDFWAELVANITTMLSAIMAGFMNSNKDVKLKTQIYENRNDFIEKYLNITDTWEKSNND